MLRMLRNIAINGSLWWSVTSYIWKYSLQVKELTMYFVCCMPVHPHRRPRVCTITEQSSHGCEAQLAWNCLFTLTFWQAILTRKLCYTYTLFFTNGEASLVKLCTQDYKCSCAAVTICETIVDRKFEFYILISVTSKSSSNWGESVGASMPDAPVEQFGDRRSVTCRDNAHISFSMMT